MALIDGAKIERVIERVKGKLKGTQWGLLGKYTECILRFALEAVAEEWDRITATEIRQRQAPWRAYGPRADALSDERTAETVRKFHQKVYGLAYGRDPAATMWAALQPKKVDGETYGRGPMPKLLSERLMNAAGASEAYRAAGEHKHSVWFHHLIDHIQTAERAGQDAFLVLAAGLVRFSAAHSKMTQTALEAHQRAIHPIYVVRDPAHGPGAYKPEV